MPIASPNLRLRATLVLTRLKRWGRMARQGAVDLVFPPTCACCGSDLSTDAFGDASTNERTKSLFCLECREELLGRAEPACGRCAARIPAAAGSECAACRGRRFAFSKVLAAGYYEGPLREAVLRTKHIGEQHLATALADLLWEQCGDRLAEFHPDVVVAVPMHWSRRVQRGTSMPDILCERTARRLRVPAAPRLLVRRRNTMRQTDIARSRRRANVRHAFRTRAAYRLTAARVLLVDDVVTTGATSSEAAAALRKAGAAEVAIAVVARADRGA